MLKKVAMDGTITFYVSPIATRATPMSQYPCSNPFAAVGANGACGLFVTKSAVAGKSVAYECVAIPNLNMVDVSVKAKLEKIKNAIHKSVVCLFTNFIFNYSFFFSTFATFNQGRIYT